MEGVEGVFQILPDEQAIYDSPAQVHAWCYVERRKRIASFLRWHALENMVVGALGKKIVEDEDCVICDRCGEPARERTALPPDKFLCDPCLIRHCQDPWW